MSNFIDELKITALSALISASGIFFEQLGVSMQTTGNSMLKGDEAKK